MRPFGGGVIGNTAGSGPAFEGSSPSPRARPVVTRPVVMSAGVAGLERRQFLGSALILGAGAALSACTHHKAVDPGALIRRATTGGGAGGGGRIVKIGCVAPFTGPLSY